MPILRGIAIFGDTAGASLDLFISHRVFAGIATGLASPDICGDSGGWFSGGSGTSGGREECSPEVPESVKLSCGGYGVALVEPILLKLEKLVFNLVPVERSISGIAGKIRGQVEL